MRFPIDAIAGTGSNSVMLNCNSRMIGKTGSESAGVPEVISQGIFRALGTAVAAPPPVFQVPSEVEDDEHERPSPAHKILKRENAPFAPKLRLGDKSISLIISIVGCI